MLATVGRNVATLDGELFEELTLSFQVDFACPSSSCGKAVAYDEIPPLPIGERAG